MCGIVGYVGKRDAMPVLIEGLHRLEYRGYDSAGLAVISRGRLQITKTAGRVQDLRDKLAAKTGTSATKATIGIGHTRWATHGEPNETNAHPHTDATNRIAVVHNGIIENAELLRDQLQANGVHLVSDTDTEALAHMIAAELAADESATLEDAVIRTLRKVEGAYGLVVLDIKNPDQLVVARNGSPIVLGLGNSEMFVASDVSALVRYTKQVIYLEDGEVATIKATDYHTTTVTAGGTENSSIKTPTTVDADADDYELGQFSDYMRKEIHEQPDAIRRALRGRLEERFATARLGGINLDARELRNIKMRQVPRLRLRLLRRPDGRRPGRGAGPHPRRRRARERVPLPIPGRRPRHALCRGLPVRRDDRHADGRPGAQAQGRPGHRRRQRRRLSDRPRVRARDLPARRPRGRRRLDQGAHQHGG